MFQPVMQSDGMRRLDRTLRVIAPKDVCVTFIGESGSGKEVLARRLHDLSHRRAGPFIPLNCAAIPESLFESELFGHERGAYTGATERAPGKLEAANGGTLFLDEVGEMPFSMQAKLLRFLENRQFMRVGGNAKISVNTRLVCATLRPLELELGAGRFRADLYYRIQGITLDVPPLRDRRSDIGPLTRYFIQHLSAKHQVEPPHVGREAMAALRGHAWPGNVRELRNVIERFTVLRAGKQVRVRDLPAQVQQAILPAAPRADGALPELVEVSLKEPLDASVGRIFRAAIAIEQGDPRRAAERLGVSLRTIQRRLAREARAGG